MQNNKKGKEKYTKPILVTHDTVKNLTKAVSNGSVDEPNGDGLN